MFGRRSVPVFLLLLCGSAFAREPHYEYSLSPLPSRLVERMRGVSWRPGCPVDPAHLRLVQLTHWGYDGRVHRGQLVVHELLAEEVAEIFGELFTARFPLARMRLIEEYGGNDQASMDDDNTSAFNCRSVTGGRAYSLHAWGAAIDINPLRNPYVAKKRILPPAGRRWLDRSLPRPGMIVRGGPVWRAFTKRGWHWGGEFKRLKDFQHFEKQLPKGSRHRRPKAGFRPRCLRGRLLHSASTISLDEWRTPLRELLARIGRVARLNIVTAEGVSGNVTLKLDSVPWPRALDAVLCSLGLHGEVDGNVIMVEAVN